MIIMVVIYGGCGSYHGCDTAVTMDDAAGSRDTVISSTVTVT